MASLIPSGSASGTGSMTLAAPVTNSNQTATLPDATGTVSVSGNTPVFGVYLGLSQNVTSGVTTKIQFNTEEFDTANAFDSTTNYRFTPQVAGYYQLNACMTPNGVAITGLTVYVYKNGSEYKRIANLGTGNPINGSCTVYLNGSTDYIEFYGNVSASSTPQFYLGQNYTYASGFLVRTS